MALTKVQGLGLGSLDDNITFSTAGKGVHLGVTSATASNLQDDYEEGTFTGGLGQYAGTPTINSAVYTKVGRLVTASINITLDGTSDASGFSITGLPFTSLDAAALYCCTKLLTSLA